MVKKNHHYIAEVYLKSFANADGKVFMCRKDDPQKVIAQNPDGLAKHKHYYRQPKPEGGFDHDSIEDMFCQVESKWPEIVKKLTRSNDVNGCMNELVQFMAIHRARVPAARDASEEMLAAMVKSTGKQLEKAGKLPPLPKKLQNLKDIWDHLTVAIDPHQSIHSMVHVLNGVADLFERIGFGALHNVTGIPFLTSDNPVIWFDPSLPEAEMRPYVLRKNGPIMFVFPVSPTIIIVGHSSMRERYASDGFLYGEVADAKEVERRNVEICRFAYEAVFSSVDTFAELVAKYSETSPVLETRTISASQGEFVYLEYAWGRRVKKPKWKK